MSSSQARDRLLAAAVEHALAGGISDLSLREIAAAIGTSHRMLLYHFGSRGGLLVAVAQAVEEAERTALLTAGTSREGALQSWKRISDPAMWPQERLFFELYSYALLGRPGSEGFLDGIVESWVAPVRDSLIAAGADKRTAGADARLGVAVVRGLLLDLLATGDRKGVDAAYRRFLDLAAPAQDSPANGRRTRTVGESRRAVRPARGRPSHPRGDDAPGGGT